MGRPRRERRNARSEGCEYTLPHPSPVPLPLLTPTPQLSLEKSNAELEANFEADLEAWRKRLEEASGPAVAA